MTKKQAQRPLIEYAVAKPYIDASMAGLGVGGFTWLGSGPFWGGVVFGASFSCLWYWGSGNIWRNRFKEKKAKRNRGRKITVQGEKWTFDQVAPQYVTRQSAIKDFAGFLGFGQRKPVQRNGGKSVPKPAWMQEKVFRSHCNGLPVQLRVSDVWRFLRWAYKYRQKGKGLSENSWIRYRDEREIWYQEVPNPQWYYAMINMLEAAEQIGKRQLIQEISGNQRCLAKEPKLIMDALCWLEDQHNNG